ncbi:MAG: hypothetical protein EXS37_10495 [Opitutus sp.]|nr:hypothetical protein [Opitutus sp.]
MFPALPGSSRSDFLSTGTVYKNQADTTTQSIVFKVTGNLRVMANRSENFAATNPRQDNLFRPIDPASGKTEEAGIGATFFGSKLDLKLTYFKSSQINVTNNTGVAQLRIPAFESRDPNQTAEKTLSSVRPPLRPPPSLRCNLCSVSPILGDTAETPTKPRRIPSFTFRLKLTSMRPAPRLHPLLFALTASQLGQAATVDDGILIDRVWSGHSVPFALLVERGYQFITYYDAERRIVVTGRKLPDGDWSRIRPEGRPTLGRYHSSRAVGWDSHNSLQLALDRDGCLHLSGNMHADPLVYYRTRLPFDVSTIERPGTRACS